MERWIGKVAIVTGASSGIGAAIAVMLAEHGMKVVGLARRKERVEALSKKLSNKKGKLYPIKADMSVEEDIIKAFKWVKDNLGPVHILVNNTGVLKEAMLINGETKEWQQMLNVNLLGLCIATREAIKQMTDSKIDGHIIHINSILGHSIPPLTHFCFYAAVKHGLTALTAGLRFELNSIKSKTKITDISPGVVKTELITMQTGSVKDFYEVNPALEPEDVANAVMYVIGTPPKVQVYELIIKPLNENI